MMHGEFALAGEVAWTSIKLAFVQGIAWVTTAWTEFAAGLATIFDGVVVAIRTAWNNLTVFIGQLLKYQVARFQTLLDRLAQFDPTGMAAKLRSALDVNVGGTITAMEEDRERFNRGLTDAREKRDAERAAHMQARLSVGALTGIAKGGWQHLWVLYGDQVDQNVLIKRPVATYVEQVYWPGDFSLLGIGT